MLMQQPDRNAPQMAVSCHILWESQTRMESPMSPVLLHLYLPGTAHWPKSSSTEDATRETNSGRVENRMVMLSNDAKATCGRSRQRVSYLSLPLGCILYSQSPLALHAIHPAKQEMWPIFRGLPRSLFRGVSSFLAQICFSGISHLRSTEPSLRGWMHNITHPQRR